MNNIEIVYDNEFEFVKVFINNKLASEQYHTKSIFVDFDKLPAEVEVEFSPHKIKPIIRYNNVMLDYWLANVLLQDHKVQITIDNNFFENYKNKNIKGRIDSLPLDQQNVEHFHDKYIGINNLHIGLVNEIKDLLNK